MYVGKSKKLRSRIRAHFNSRREKRLCKQIDRIECKETAGELGALLLESRLIKELRPLYNQMARRIRPLIILRESITTKGYASIKIEEVEYLDVTSGSPILAVFKHKKQMKEYLASILKTHELCARLLKLENGSSYCFSYHLGQCRGACVEEEEPAAYNSRFYLAFEERRVKAWPYPGVVVITESSTRNDVHESFYIFNWCLVGSMRRSNEASEQWTPIQHRFDYDSYKILLAFLTDGKKYSVITVGQDSELTRFFANRFPYRNLSSVIQKL